MTQEYILYSEKDNHTIALGIKDCLTKTSLKPGDKVVVCRNCKLSGVYLVRGMFVL